MKDRLSWVALFILALVLIVAGFQGAVGRLLACILVPVEVIMDEKF